MEALAGLVPLESAGITAVRDDSRTSEPPRVDVSARPAVAFGPNEAAVVSPTKSPRAALLEALSRAITETAAVGDLEAARVAHEALGRLLATVAADPDPRLA